MKRASFHRITSRSNFRIFLEEKRWQRAVEKQDIKRCGQALHRSDRLCRAIVLLGLLFTALDGRRRLSRWPVIVLGMPESPLHKAIQEGLTQKTGDSSMRLASMTSGCSLIQLEAAQLLITRPWLVTGLPRKWMLHFLIKWIDKQLSSHATIFFLKEDYYGRNSLLTTLSLHSGLKVVGIQHGLMRFRHLLDDDIYPGIRTKHELAYNSNYVNLFRQLKAVNTQVCDFGPPFEGQNKRHVQEHSDIRSAIFISSGDLQTPDAFPMLQSMKQIFDELGIHFLIRPHPSEIGIETPGIDRDSKSKGELLGDQTDSLLLFGFFSTLLYESAWHGFQTIWLIADSEIDAGIPEIGSLPGAEIIPLSLFSPSFLKLKLLSPRAPVQRPGQTLASRISRFIEHDLSPAPR